MSFVSGFSAFVSFVGFFPARAFSPDAKDLQHDFACSLDIPSPPFVEISPEVKECANCKHKEGTFHVCEEWVIVPDTEQQEHCICCVFVEGVPSICRNKRIEACICCAYIEGVPNVCINRRGSSDSDSE